MTFLFLAGLLALPLAALPVLLHLLFRRKSPVVHFPTLRFIKASIQQTAARRKIQRWLLLACRILLLALLILAIAQPARQLASAWMTSDQAAVAVIVVDTSYSMMLQPDPTGGTNTLLDKADATIQDLLRDQLKDARVAILRSLPPPPGQPETFREVGAIQKDWTGLKPQPSPLPLARRIDVALGMLANDPAPQKWLFVLTDVQAREFTQPIQAPPEIKTVLLDLHPDEPRSAGVTSVLMDPEDPIPGIGSEAVVEIAGRSGDSRAATLTVAKVDAADAPLLTKPPLMAAFDTSGRAQVRFPTRLPAERFMLVRASLQAQDALPWDNDRVQLVEVPPRQNVTLLDTAPGLAANRFLRLALDPTDGAGKEWPLAVARSPTLTGKETVAAVNLATWPSLADATRLRDFVRGGGTLLLNLQPGLEETFKGLPDDLRRTLLEVLPSSPTASPAHAGAYRAAAGGIDDPLLKGLTDKKFAIDGIVVRRFVPLATPDGDATTVLSISPANPGPGARPYPLLVRRKVGTGVVYTTATLPEPRYTSLPTHPLFLPLVVRMSLRATAHRDVQNVELGQALVLTGPQFAGFSELQLEAPDRARYVIKPASGKNGKQFSFEGAAAPGIYTWRAPGDTQPVALSNVQYPSAEADLTYRPATTVLAPSETHLIARSLPDLQGLLAKATEPEPQWAIPIVIVMFLLCLEALMGSLPRLWQTARTPWAAAKPA